jgi:hypothetical protein
MYLILLVLNDPDRLEDLLIAWEEQGVDVATVIFSTGFERIRQLRGWRDDMPLMPSLRDFYEATENLNRTVFTMVDRDEQVDAIVTATERVVGSLDEEKTGVLLVLPVAKAYGISKRKLPGRP